MTAVNPYEPLNCPMRDCGQPLYLAWSAALSLTVGALVEGGNPPVIADADSTTWRIECLDGHVVLLPGQLGCPCEDQIALDCPHADSPESDGFDWSEDFRTFRPNDIDRLNSLLSQWSS